MEKYIWVYDIYVHSEEDKENKLSVIKKYLNDSDISLDSTDSEYDIPRIRIRCTDDVFNNIRSNPDFNIGLIFIHIYEPE